MAVGHPIDTSMISELRHPDREPPVVSRFEQHPARRLCVSVLSLGEIRRGVERLPEDERRERLRTWVRQDLPLFFSGRLLAVDEAVANRSRPGRHPA